MDTSSLAYQHILRDTRKCPASRDTGGAMAGTSHKMSPQSDIYAPLFWLFHIVMKFITGESHERVLRSELPVQNCANRKHRRIETRVMNLHRVPSARQTDILLKLRPAYVRTPAQFVNWAAGLYVLGRTSMLGLPRWSARKTREASMALFGVINWTVSQPLTTIGGLSTAQLPPD